MKNTWTFLPLVAMMIACSQEQTIAKGALSHKEVQLPTIKNQLMHLDTFPQTIEEPPSYSPIYIEEEEDIEIAEEECIEFPSIAAEFPGGRKSLVTYLRKNIKYPAVAREMGIEGRVIVEFIVEEDGAVNNGLIIHAAHSILDKEVMRVLREMPNWTPAEEFGKKVKAKHTLPINFSLKRP